MPGAGGRRGEERGGRQPTALRTPDGRWRAGGDASPKAQCGMRACSGLGHSYVPPTSPRAPLCPRARLAQVCWKGRLSLLGGEDLPQ